MSDDIADVELEWNQKRWDGVKRPYSAEDVVRLRGSLRVEHTLARVGAEKFWRGLQSGGCISALGAMTGNQAVQAVQSGLKAIYVSGWQVAADANLAGQTYPDQSLYPHDSVPSLVRRINHALERADQIERSQGKSTTDWYVPIVADGEAGFGGPLNVFELTKSMIDAGAACVHYEDQLSSEKKCGHMGGKVLVPTSQFIRSLVAARFAADITGTPTLIIARTDAEAASLVTSDIDSRDRRFITGERTPEGFYKVRNGLEAAIARGIAYAPYSDLLWFETATPDMEEAVEFAREIHSVYPGKLLAYNCSPSFNWEKNLTPESISSFPRRVDVPRISLPVHHAGRLPRAQPLDVQARHGVRERRDVGLRAAPEGGVRGRAERLRSGQAPGVRGHQLLRRRGLGHQRWRGFHSGDEGLDRGRAVRLGSGQREKPPCGRLLPRRARAPSRPFQTRCGRPVHFYITG